MKRILLFAVAALLAVPATTQAQTMVESLKGLHDTTSGNIVATAEMLDAELYAFQPTEEVRSVGQLLGHIANAQYLFCAAAAGESSPNSQNWEESASDKAAIVAALNAAFAYCAGVYDATSDADAAKQVTFFGAPNTVGGVLAFNSAHNYEHYGNLVTYMRINGITPPSSM